MTIQRTHARESIHTGEIAAVVAHYHLGPVLGVVPLDRGSALAPKVLLRTPTGVYLLKRRAAGRDSAERVALSHAVHAALQHSGIPVPPLVRTRETAAGPPASKVVVAGRTYEVFRYVPGDPYDGSLEATHAAGRTLALYHAALAGFDASAAPRLSTPHAAAGLLDRLLTALTDPAGALNAADAATARTLAGVYDFAARRADEVGIGDLPLQFIHADWHPGNLIFQERRVVAVLDHDSSGPERRVVDLAYGGLHFSMIRDEASRPPTGEQRFTTAAQNASKTPENWPDSLDLERFAAFFVGYSEAGDRGISVAEAAVTPWLMIESMIAEAAVGITRPEVSDRGAFLQMVLGKARWIGANAPALTSVLTPDATPPPEAPSPPPAGPAPDSL